MKPYKELIATLALSAGFLMAAYSVFILGRDSALLTALVGLAAALSGLAGVAYGKRQGLPG